MGSPFAVDPVETERNRELSLSPVQALEFLLDAATSYERRDQRERTVQLTRSLESGSPKL